MILIFSYDMNVVLGSASRGLVWWDKFVALLKRIVFTYAVDEYLTARLCEKIRTPGSFVCTEPHRFRSQWGQTLGQQVRRFVEDWIGVVAAKRNTGAAEVPCWNYILN
ncbi:MAG TPA: hypothetical protein VMF91_25275 [Bryobacteraceae bacterium]|nr:hypothetical protein [Bryobacteraceae bacterium]